VVKAIAREEMVSSAQQ